MDALKMAERVVPIFPQHENSQFLA